MNKPFKFWLVGMTGPGEVENLKEVIEPIYDQFDGLVWTFHIPADSGADYLESRKGQGEILYTKYCRRHDLSRNIYLHQGPIKEGDYFVGIDTMEKLLPEFFNRLPQLFNILISNDIDGVYLHGKRFMFRYNELMEHAGNPHEYIKGVNRAVELTKIAGFENSVEYFTNLRPQKRDKYHFVRHFGLHFWFPAGSNGMLLGLDDNIPEFHRREAQRLECLKYCRNTLGINSADEFIDWIQKHPLTTELKQFINREKILNDIYRYYVLGDRNFGSDLKVKDMITV